MGRPSTDVIIAAARRWVLLTLRVIKCRRKHLGEENIIPGLLGLMISHAHLIIMVLFFLLHHPKREIKAARQGVFCPL